MGKTVKRKKRWFLKVELAVLVCVVCIWVIMLVTVGIDSTKAAVLKQVVKISPDSADAVLLTGQLRKPAKSKPPIQELPASQGIELKPMLLRMLANQVDMELNNVTRWFNSQVSVLNQLQLEPDKYKAQYTNLQRQAINQRVAIQAKNQAYAQQIKNMQKLVEVGTMSSEQMEQTMLVMLGIPIDFGSQRNAGE